MTDLTDRMRTCAAYIMSRPHDAPMPTEHLLDDAAELLIEASNLLEAVPAPLGEPMEIIEPGPHMMQNIPPIVTQNAPPIVEELRVGQWVASGDTLVSNPYRGRHTCPRCDSRANKKVRRDGKRLMLACPVCAHEWEFKPR